MSREDGQFIEQFVTILFLFALMGLGAYCSSQEKREYVKTCKIIEKSVCLEDGGFFGDFDCRVVFEDGSRRTVVDNLVIKGDTVCWSHYALEYDNPPKIEKEAPR